MSIEKILVISVIFISACELPRDIGSQVNLPIKGEKKSCSPKTLSIHVSAEIGSLDPLKIRNSAENQVAMLALPQLVKMDEFENIYPYLAKKWDVSQNGSKYRFYLNDDSSYSDQGLDADDVIYSFERIFHPKLDPTMGNFLLGDLIIGAKEYSKGKTSSIRGIKKVSKYVVDITIFKKTPSFLHMLAMGPISIFPAQKSFEFFSGLDSRGPYQVERHSLGQVALKASTWTDKSHFDAISYSSTNLGLCELLESRAFDIVNTDTIGKDCGKHGYNSRSIPAANLGLIAIGKGASLDDARELRSCLDRVRMVQNLDPFGHSLSPLDSLFPKRSPKSYLEKDERQRCKRHKKRRKIMFRENSFLASSVVGELIKQIPSLEAQPVSEDVFKHRKNSGEFDFSFYKFNGMFSDPYLFASLVAGGGSVIKIGHSDLKIDKLVKMIANSADAQSARLLQAKLDILIKEKPFVIPLFQSKTLAWVKKDSEVNTKGWAFIYQTGKTKCGL